MAVTINSSTTSGLVMTSDLSGNLQFSTSSTEAMRIDSSGNVGIGTSSPVSKLNVYGSAGTANITMSDSTLGVGYGGQIRGYGNVGIGGYLDIGVLDNSVFTRAIRVTEQSKSIQFSTSSTEAMRIDSSGNVGIGTSSPTTLLQLGGATNKSMRIDSATGNAAFLGTFQTLSTFSANRNPSTGAFADTGKASAFISLDANVSNGQILFATTASNNTEATERMRIDSSGNLLVGATTVGTTNSNSFTITTASGAYSINHASGTASGSYYCGIGYGGGIIGSITQSGTTAVLFNVTSDQRLKENIVDAPSGNINDIKVRSFDWIADGSHQTYGMVAQELLKVAPYAVHQPQDAEEMMAVDYSKLVPMMIKEIQELKQRIATLEK